jgi:hypothetical protein
MALVKKPTLSHSDKLNGESNYELWKESISFILKGQNLFGWVRPPVGPIPTDEKSEEYQEWEAGNCNARSIIIMNCNNEARILINNQTYAHVMWSKLKDRYETHRNSRKLIYWKEFVGMTYEKYGSLNKYIVTFRSLLEDLRALDVQISDDIVILMFIEGLASAYPSWKERNHSRFRDDPTLTLDIVIRDSIDHARSVESTAILKGTTLIANKPPKKLCTHCRKKGHLVADCWVKYPEKKKKKTKDQDDTVLYSLMAIAL